MTIRPPSATFTRVVSVPIAIPSRCWQTFHRLSSLRNARSAPASSTPLLARRLGASLGDQLVGQGDPFGHVAPHHFLRAPDRLPHREEPELPVVELQDHVITDLDAEALAIFRRDDDPAALRDLHPSCGHLTSPDYMGEMHEDVT